MRVLQLLLLSLLAGLFSRSPVNPAERQLCQHAAEQYACRIEFTKLILARTAEHYGELSFAARVQAEPTQGRRLRMLRGLVDLALAPPPSATLLGWSAPRLPSLNIAAGQCAKYTGNKACFYSSTVRGKGDVWRMTS
jgi:hypothetical protein